MNRVSLGVQSFVDEEAHASGRLHDRATVADGFAAVAGSGNLELKCRFDRRTRRADFCIVGGIARCVDRLGGPARQRLHAGSGRGFAAGPRDAEGRIAYRAGLVPSDDAIARMYERRLSGWRRQGCSSMRFRISRETGFESRHNLRYWERRPYLGLGLDASSMLRCEPTLGANAKTRRGWGTLDPVVRATTTDDLKAYLAGPETAEMAWLSPERQHEEAWFLGLRLNAGVDLAALEEEFGKEMVEPAMKTVKRLDDDGLVTFDGDAYRLTARGRLISNDVFQEFLGVARLERSCVPTKAFAPQGDASAEGPGGALGYQASSSSPDVEEKKVTGDGAGLADCRSTEWFRGRRLWPNRALSRLRATPPPASGRG